MELIAVVLAVFAAQVVKGITGFGAQLVALPVLAVLWSPAEAIFVTALLDLFSGMGLLMEVRRHVVWSLAAAIFLPMMAGLWIGSGLILILPVNTLLLMLGVVVAAVGAGMAWEPVRPGLGEVDSMPEDGGHLLLQGAAAGLLGGLMGGTVGPTGPPVIVWARRWFTDRFFRVQMIAVLAGAAAVLPVMFLIRGAAEPASLWKLPWLLPVVFAGAASGAWLAPRLSRVAFGRVVGLVLTVAGIALLVRAAATW